MTAASHKIVVGDILLPLNRIIRLGPSRDPVDLSLYTVKFQMKTDAGVSVVAESTTGVVPHPTQVFTLDSTNNWITCAAHGNEVGNVWVPATSGSFSGTGLTAATRYKIVEVDTDWFRVSVRSGGGPVTIAGAGTGTHTGYEVGGVQKMFLAADVATAGNYRAWFTLYSASSPASWPDDALGIPIEIAPRGN